MEQLIVTTSPHIRSSKTTTKIMLDVIIALVPALIASVILFGFQALLVVMVSVTSCVVFEYFSRRIMKRGRTLTDLSAVVTGILLAFNLPVTLPLWMVVIGAFVAIVIAKQLFGGLGQNLVNPAILGRIVLLVSFPAQMTTWAAPFYYQSAGTDVVTTATPLADITGITSSPTLMDMFLGVRGGCLGETCTLALLLGGIYLMIRRVISPVIPVTYIGVVYLFTAALGVNPNYQVMAGGLILGAFFMATDYTTSPATGWGKFIFAIGCGVITVVIRVFGSYPEGVSFAILLMNILVPWIDKITQTKPFGKVKKPRNAAAAKK